jgi:Uri superfamily endonuclease
MIDERKKESPKWHINYLLGLAIPVST